MRISDWSSDVCSSDLLGNAVAGEGLARTGDERVADARVPATGDDREAHAVRSAQVAFVVGHAGNRSNEERQFSLPSTAPSERTGARPGIRGAGGRARVRSYADSRYSATSRP